MRLLSLDSRSFSVADVFCFGVALLAVYALPVPRLGAAPPGFVVENVANGLASPVTFAFAPDGRIFYNELDQGWVRVIENGSVVPTPFGQLSVTTLGEQGLLGLALHPDFENNGFVYVCFSRSAGGHEIGRFTAVGNVGTNYTPIVTGLPSSGIHNGGNIAFGPDGKLYHTMGDTANSGNSQNNSTYPGKIHRFNDDGTVPADNPYPGGLSSRYCMGLRNSFDLCWNHTLGLLYASENGPGSDDEVNLIQPANNYGWPTVSCSGGGAFTAALTCWTPTIAPTGITAYTDSQFGAQYLHDLFMADFNGGRIWWIQLTPNGMNFVTRSVFHDEPGFVFDVVQGPEGYLYFSTGNAIRRIRRLPVVDAPTGLSCTVTGEDVVLNWTNQGAGAGDAYDTVVVEVDGAVLATLPGDSQSYTHVDAPGGLRSYEVFGEEGGESSDPVGCTAMLDVDAVSGLVCDEDNGLVDLSWTNEDVYTTVVIQRDGSLLTALPGDTTTYSDAGPLGISSYQVIGSVDNDLAPEVTCDVQIGDLFIRGDTNNDGGIDIADGILLLGYSFANDPAPVCLISADMNNDGNIDVADTIAILNYLFAMGPGSEACVSDSDPLLDCLLYDHCP